MAFEKVDGHGTPPTSRAGDIRAWLVQVSRSVYFATPDWPGDEAVPAGTPAIAVTFLVVFPDEKSFERHSLHGSSVTVLAPDGQAALDLGVCGQWRFGADNTPPPFRLLEG